VKTLLSLLLAVWLAVPAVAGQNNLGSAGAQFLKIGVGSRYQGMAEASTAVANDVYSMYWNPAGLAGIEEWAIGFTNVNWLLDVNLNYVAVAKRFEDIGVFGASVTVLSTGEQEVTTVLQQNGTGENYSASSYAIGFSYSRQLTDQFAFGGTVKVIGEELGRVDSRGVGVDFGTMLHTGFRSLRFGMSIANVGPDLKFSGEALKIGFDDQSGSGANDPVDAELRTSPYSLPLTFRLGVAYDLEFGPKSILLLAGDFSHPNDDEQKASLGAQFGFMERFFLRGGYKINYDEETLAFGAGLSAPINDATRIEIDYAWQDFGRLESTQRFSVGFAF